MKSILLLLIVIVYSNIIFANIDSLVQRKFDNADLSEISSIDQLSSSIKGITTNPKEELELLLLWTERYMQPDDQRFFNNSVPLTANESIKKRTGLCDEYCNIFSEFCKKNGILSIRVEGYVKEIDARNQTYDQTNHAWNAVYIDSTWLLCDIFWSTCELKKKDGSLSFNKRLDTKYFLNNPSAFIESHLPADPLFQFSNTPVQIDNFINSDAASVVAYDYKDSLSKFLKLNEQNQLLQIAKNSYQFNKHNPNMLIATYYNYATTIYNNPKSKNPELLKAIDYLKTAGDLIGSSSITSIQDLSAPIKEAIKNLNLRVAFNKQHKS